MRKNKTGSNEKKKLKTLEKNITDHNSMETTTTKMYAIHLNSLIQWNDKNNKVERNKKKKLGHRGKPP